eukprot:2758435-Pleurochrysis_carterae.AAC.1
MCSLYVPDRGELPLVAHRLHLFPPPLRHLRARSACARLDFSSSLARLLGLLARRLDDAVKLIEGSVDHDELLVVIGVALRQLLRVQPLQFGLGRRLEVRRL